MSRKSSKSRPKRIHKFSFRIHLFSEKLKTTSQIVGIAENLNDEATIYNSINWFIALFVWNIVCILSCYCFNINFMWNIFMNSMALLSYRLNNNKKAISSFKNRFICFFLWSKYTGNSDLFCSCWTFSTHSGRTAFFMCKSWNIQKKYKP